MVRLKGQGAQGIRIAEERKVNILRRPESQPNPNPYHNYLSHLLVTLYSVVRCTHRAIFFAVHISNPTMLDNSSRIQIDGSRGEGGGQIVRNAIAYAVLLHRAISIHSIRAGRSKPGLRAQHLTCLRLCRDIVGGTLTGDAVGSREISYDPPRKQTVLVDQHVDGINHVVGDTGTAGSICLLLQAALPVALYSKVPIQMELRGGTNASMAPQVDYLTGVMMPIAVANFGLSTDILVEISRRGFYPKGGGCINVLIPPLPRQKLRPIRLTNRGQIAKLRVSAFSAGNCPLWVANQMASAAMEELKACAELKHVLCKANVDIALDSCAIGSASGIILIAETTTGCILGGSGLGDRKIKPQKTGVECAKELMSAIHSGGCVDGWLQDQVILFMALADGVSEILTSCLTLHTQSAMDIASKMTGAEFEVIRLDGDRSENSASLFKDCSLPYVYGVEGLVTGNHLIRCKGIGHMPIAV